MRVATYAHELFASHGDLDAVYVPIGMGSGICGLITVRHLLGCKTEIVGVVAEAAPTHLPEGAFDRAGHWDQLAIEAERRTLRET
jgi:hypothetical protein